MSGVLQTQGFLGTKANFGVDLALIAMLLVALLLSMGYYLARKKNFKGHKWVQTIGVVFSTLVVVAMMILPYVQLISQGKGNHSPFPYSTTILHGAIGIIATIFGIFVMMRGHNLIPGSLSFKRHYKTYMRLAYWLYIAATLMGIVAYLAWYT